MRLRDLIAFSFRAAGGHLTRTLLSLLAMAIGVAAVVVLTSLGEGARLYVRQQFTSLGTHLLIVLPGRNETTGGPPPLLGLTPRDLTLDDALGLDRSRAVLQVAPVTVGSAPAAYSGREREVTVLGTTAEMLAIRQLSMAQGRFLPAGDVRRAVSVCVLGDKAASELFGKISPLGRWLRLGNRRYRVIGVLAPQGTSLGVDMSDVVLLPVASAQALFNVSGLFRVIVQAKSRELIGRAKSDILGIIKARHEGEDDVTVITQDAMLATFDRILGTLTLAVGGIAAISLLVAGILIMNVMLISVSQRAAEIGLLKAIGATARQILMLFLTEAGLLACLGSAIGLAISYAAVWLAHRLYPDFPAFVPIWALVAGVGMALGTSLLFGTLPARRAARLDPVASLSRR